MIETHLLALAGITLLAAFVNGALGYGFSSITVPLALLFMANRVLNPALVLIEVVLNAYVLWVNREAFSGVWRRLMPMVIGLIPGIAIGTAKLASVNSSWLRFYTFMVLLPLILLQAAGYRRPIKSERGAGLVFGGALGVLYSVTTISGPPLAIVLNNQGLAKRDFRAALGVVRLAESSMTAVAYAYAGLFTIQSLDRAEHRGRCTARGLRDPADERRNVPPHLHEFRCVGRGVRHGAAAAGAQARSEQRVVSGAGRDDRHRCVVAVPFLHTPLRGTAPCRARGSQ